MADARDGSDDAWLASLAGRPVVDGDPRASDEGAWMRDAMLRWTPDVASSAASDPRRLADLLARARAEGLIPDLRRPSWRDRWRAAWAPRRGFGGLAAAFSIACVCGIGAVVWQVQRAPDVDEVVRSAPDGVTVIRVADPAVLQKEIVDALAHAGIPATTYTRFGRRGIDADLPVPLPAPVADVLARHRIPPPADGTLKVEIEAGSR